MNNLLRKSLTQFFFCTLGWLLLATPLFYFLTKNFYAEELMDFIESVKSGMPIPVFDLERDIIMGIMIQFFVIVIVLTVSLAFAMRFLSKRLWKPFDDTLCKMERFKLEENQIPLFHESNIKEFSRLNKAISSLIKKNVNSYKVQREFTENASHELQTPIAVFQSQLDMLLQSPNLTEEQANIIQNLYQVSARLSQLNKDLLLLAKINNSQFEEKEKIALVQKLHHIIDLFDGIMDSSRIHLICNTKELYLFANATLLESLLSNLLTNAIRHAAEETLITITIEPQSLSITNLSKDDALDVATLFTRFSYKNKDKKGNGLGLPIVKAICEHHGWDLHYHYTPGQHTFCVNF
ncbi:MAG: HAMP domain-containing sensor histidine kinase [Bacteroidaceae bacterium]